MAAWRAMLTCGRGAKKLNRTTTASRHTSCDTPRIDFSAEYAFHPCRPGQHGDVFGFTIRPSLPPISSFHFRGPSRTCPLTRWPGEARESESAAKEGDLAAILVNSRESAAKRPTSVTRCQKRRNVRQLWRRALRKKGPGRLVCRPGRLPGTTPNATLLLGARISLTRVFKGRYVVHCIR